MDGYLPAVRAALAIAHDDGLIPANPASALKVRAPKAVKLRERDLSDDEAAAILRATMGPHSEKLAPDHARARRWVPWLCAYTLATFKTLTLRSPRSILPMWLRSMPAASTSASCDRPRSTRFSDRRASLRSLTSVSVWIEWGSTSYQSRRTQYDARRLPWARPAAALR